MDAPVQCPVWMHLCSALLYTPATAEHFFIPVVFLCACRHSVSHGSFKGGLSSLEAEAGGVEGDRPTLSWPRQLLKEFNSFHGSRTG